MPSRKPQQLRIIGGRWRGRKLTFPDVAAIRPTPDRVRETLFNWLQTEIVDSHCLDLFAGSGILGLEAQSRGAASVTLVENDDSAVQQLHEHVKVLGAAAASIVHQDALAFLRRKPVQTYNIVFLDPPFAKGLLAPTIELLEQQAWLSDRAWIYMEAEKTLTELPLPPNWSLHRSKTAGQVGYHLAKRVPPCEDVPHDGSDQDNT